MQNDEIIWQVINHGFCSYKSKVAKEQTFCRNVYNVTGLCNRSSCPLANSRYATIREHEGKIYLYMKTIERAHMPKKLWERVKLSQNYTRALEQVTEALEFFPKAQQHRNKQRLTKIYQYLIRSRKLKLRKKSEIVTVNKQQEKLESRREVKALTAAKVEGSIKHELLERLKRGTYGDIYNFPEAQYNDALDAAQKDDDMDEVAAAEEAEEEYEIEEEDDEDVGISEYVAGDSDMETDEEDDIEDQFESLANQKRRAAHPRKDSAPKKKGRRVEVEYENEDEDAPQEIEVREEQTSW